MKPVPVYSKTASRAWLAPVMASAALWARAGHADPHAADAWPIPRPLERETPATRGGNTEMLGGRSPLPLEPSGVLTLREALDRALLHSPALAAAGHAVRAAEGEAVQASARPNPVLELDAEEFGGSDPRQGYGAAQTVVALRQSLELGGKRDRRQRLAGSEARLAGWDYEARRLAVVASAKQAFVDVLAAQSRLALTESLRLTAEGVRQAAAERVNAGKVTPLEATKASVEAAEARLAQDQARRELDTARRRLAAEWGGHAPVFTHAEGTLDAVGDLPPFAQLAALVDAAPAIARGSEEVTMRRESLRLDQAMRVPDLTVAAGLARFEEDGSYAATVGLALPLPLFDRQAGRIAAARHRAAQAEQQQLADRVRLTTDLLDAYLRTEGTRTEALAMRAELLPGAQQAFDAAQAGYREGRFGHLDVLDAQRTLSRTRMRYLDMLAAYHKAAADLERMTGLPLTTIE